MTDRRGLPLNGWEWLSVTDHRDMAGTCDACGQRQIRYVHSIRHRTRGTLLVGRVCAARLVGPCVDLVRAERDAPVAGKQWMELGGQRMEIKQICGEWMAQVGTRCVPLARLAERCAGLLGRTQ